MSPYELMVENGSVEHWNQEPGQVWMQRIIDTWDKVIWLNPSEPDYWKYSSSTQMIRQQLQDRMFPLTLAGLDAGIGVLSK